MSDDFGMPAAPMPPVEVPKPSASPEESLWVMLEHDMAEDAVALARDIGDKAALLKFLETQLPAQAMAFAQKVLGDG